MNSNNIKNYYKILNIPQSANKNEIKNSYRKLVKIWHPDVCKHSDAHEKTSELIEAYDTLIDENKRRDYDSLLKMNSGNQFVYSTSGTYSASTSGFKKESFYANYQNAYSNYKTYSGSAYERDFGYKEESEETFTQTPNEEDSTSDINFENSKNKLKSKNLFKKIISSFFLGSQEIQKKLNFFDYNFIGFKFLLISLIYGFAYLYNYSDFLYLIVISFVFVFFNKKKYIGLIPALIGIIIVALETGLAFAIFSGIRYFLLQQL